ncbi:hypothetical protein, partial [Streptomyces sp. NPDC001508]|uniref:hypothetical protein n=1 Tax=Streptomyces sp. NPDC001508 TaxID=3154656 RepID=UPI00331EB8BA
GRRNSHHPRSAGTSSHFPVPRPTFTRWIQAESERPYAKARRPVGRIAIANSDAQAFGYTHAAFDAAYRAVSELV